MPVDFSNLAAAVENAFGETVTVSRTSGGTFSAATGTRGGGSTVTASFAADVQKTNRRTRPMGGSGSMVEEEFIVNIRKATVAATALGTVLDGDTLTVSATGIVSRVVLVEPEAAGSMLRCVCRSEKR